MNSLIRKTATPFGVFVVAALFLIVMAIIALSGLTHATNSNVPQSGRLITIHDRGTEKVILSQATTIGDALKEANIIIDNKDAVEPAISEKLVASDYQINIYRARPVVIIDGNMRTKVVTPYQTADQIATNAGIVLYPEDKTAIGRVDNLAEGAGLQLTITRSIPFSFTLYGKTTTVRTQGKTIGEMLVEKDINLSQDDRVLPNQDSALVNGMTVRVWREGKQTISIDEPVDFDVEKIQNANQQVGYLEITTPGVVGLRSVTYEVTIQDGQEVNRTEIASVIINPAVNQVESVGVLVPYTGTGMKTQWLEVAGIDESDWGYVDYIISHESGWNPNSINAASGACGLAQALPCSKVPGNPLDPIMSLKWANNYAHTCVRDRMYCGWEGAYNFWVNNKWW